MKLPTILVLLLSVVFLKEGPPKPPNAKDELKKLQGVWVVISVAE
jgi:hypothetical protein